MIIGRKLSLFISSITIKRFKSFIKKTKFFIFHFHFSFNFTFKFDNKIQGMKKNQVNQLLVNKDDSSTLLSKKAFTAEVVYEENPIEELNTKYHNYNHSIRYSV